MDTQIILLLILYAALSIITALYTAINDEMFKNKSYSSIQLATNLIYIIDLSLLLISDYYSFNVPYKLLIIAIHVIAFNICKTIQCIDLTNFEELDNRYVILGIILIISIVAWLICNTMLIIKIIVPLMEVLFG